MPWPWHMAQHCLNFHTGDVITWPLPNRPWPDNAPFLDAMQTVWNAYRFFQTDPAKWEPPHLDYYDWLYSD